MKPSANLFDLIHSMTAAEKRFFRLESKPRSAGQSPLYLRLFDLLLTMDHYDERAAKQHFHGEPCLRQFTRAKNYLYHRLLQSLRQFHAQHSVRRRCLAHLDSVDLLTTRQLYQQALRALDRSKSLAQKYALTDLLPPILAWERRLLRATSGKRHAEALAHLADKEAEARRDLEREQNLHALYDQFWLLNKKRLSLAAIDFKAVEALGRSPALQWPLEELTFEAALGQKLSLAIYHRLRGEMEASLGHYWGAVQVWENTTGMAAAYPDRFLRAVVAFLYSCHAAGDYSEFTRLLARIKEDASLSGVDMARITTMGLNLQLLYCLNKQALGEGTGIAAKLGLELEKGIAPLSVWIPGTVNLSIYHFLSEDFKAARRGLGKVLDLPRGKEWADVRELARLLWLPVLYELGEYELLGYALRSMVRYVQHRRALNALEEQARRFFGGVDRNPDFVARMEGLREWEAVLEAAEGEGAMGAEVFRIWIGSRLRNVSMEAFRKKLREID